MLPRLSRHTAPAWDIPSAAMFRSTLSPHFSVNPLFF
jgi:hypothetical protein